MPDGLKDNRYDQDRSVVQWKELADGDEFAKKNNNVVLPTSQGGAIAKFNDAVFKARVKENKPYRCLRLLDWSSPTESQHRLSIDSAKVMRKSERKFPKGVPPKDDGLAGFELTIAIPEVAWNPMRHVGSMPRVSPDEDAHIVWHAMACCITSGGSKEDREKWGKLRKTVIHKFQLCPKDKIGIPIADLREARGEKTGIGSWSVMQRVENVIGEKMRLALAGKRHYSSVSSNELAKVLRQVKLAERSEQFKGTFIAAAIVVAEKSFLLEGARASLNKLESLRASMQKSSLQSVYQL